MSADVRSRAGRVGTGWLVLALAVLGFALFYTVAYAFFAPFPGFDYDARWTVIAFEFPGERDPAVIGGLDADLQIGDRLQRIGDLTYERYNREITHERTNREIPVVPFWGTRPGETVPIVYEREGEIRHTTWVILGPTPVARWTRLIGLAASFLPFWLAGTAVLLFLRPRDQRWRLMVFFNYGIALFIATGGPSVSNIAASDLVLRVLSYLLVPVFLHFHLLVPTRLFPRFIQPPVLLLYLPSLALLAIELIRPLPGVVFRLLMLVAILGSLLMLLIRFFRPEPPAARLALRLMLAGIGLAFGPAVVLYLIPGVMNVGVAGRVRIIISSASISLQPFFYIYALYKHRFGALEFRANRLLSLVSFLVAYVTLYMLVFVLASRWVSLAGEMLAFSFVLSGLFVIAALPLRTPFQRWVDRLAYGTVHNPDDIIRAFADEIPRALNQSDLARLLTREVAPSLLIRQSALYLVSGNDATCYYADGVAPGVGETTGSEIRALLATAGVFRPEEPADPSPFAWVRLPVEVKVGGTVVGVWLLGKRDPDDFYPRRDIELLKTLANQIGVALETSRALTRLEDRAAELARAYGELQVLDRLKDEFVENVSHELRTPLTFVRGYTELMLEGGMGELAGEQRETLEHIAEWTEGVVRMVNDIIDLQQGVVERIDPEQVNVAALARSCVAALEMVAARAPNDGPSHRFRIVEEGDIPSVWADRSRLRQVLDNVLENAVKFSPQGGVIGLRIRPRQYRFADSDSGQRPAVQISISDQGVGIPADQLDRIWERFHKVDGSSTREFGGLGLGLTIVHALVRASGGVIWAESAEGVGSTFHIVLPSFTGQE